MARKKIVIGLDFDGVVAYNPFRILRAPVSYIKKRFLKVKRLKFFVPKNPAQVLLWKLFHESSIFPAKGADLIRKLGNDPNYELHLITARYDFLLPSLLGWLKKNHLLQSFKSINSNVNNLQPHIYKEDMVKKLNLDYFVEDNLDIVFHLRPRSGAQILWIYNIADKLVHGTTESDFPYLQKALEKITSKK